VPGLIGISASAQGHAEVRVHAGLIDLRQDRAPQIVIANMADDANNLEEAFFRSLRLELKTAADGRRTAAERPPGERVVDHDHPSLVVHVVRGEVAAGN
jgi:hypothetical protein